MEFIKVYLDFDGTMVEDPLDDYPTICKYNEGAFEVLKKLQNAGCEIILNTLRIYYEGDVDDIIDWLEEPYDDVSNQGVRVWDYNIPKIMPPKFNMDDFIEKGIIFIDDICEGTPLIPSIHQKGGMMVDWATLDKVFEEKGLYL